MKKRGEGKRGEEAAKIRKKGYYDEGEEACKRVEGLS